ncbi:hypothetical protein ACFQU2_12015 [Siccirubricoccus deserti]
MRRLATPPERIAVQSRLRSALAWSFQGRIAPSAFPAFRRSALATTFAAAALAGAGPSHPPDPLEAAGWRHVEWHGVPPASFRLLPNGGIGVQAEAQGSFVWRRVQGMPACLGWRWRVDQGHRPPI